MTGDQHEDKYGFVKQFSVSSTESLVKTYNAEKLKSGSGNARMHFVLALTEELKKRNALPDTL